MRLVFYYHVSIAVKKQTLFAPSFGIFLDELAKNVDELILLAHTQNMSHDVDFELKSKI